MAFLGVGILPTPRAPTFDGQPQLPLAVLADHLRAIEEARYTFAVNGRAPFNDAFPNDLFLHQARRIQVKECLLKQRYSRQVMAGDVRTELQRIERSTRAPMVWTAMKAALHDSEQLIEIVICRPILVDRELRQRFGTDDDLQSAARQAASDARLRLIAGETPTGPGWFHQVRLCRSDADWLRNQDLRDSCTGLGGPAARAATTSFMHGRAVTPLLDNGGTYLVLRRTKASPPYRADGFEVTKADYHAWVDAMTATCAEQR